MSRPDAYQADCRSPAMNAKKQTVFAQRRRGAEKSIFSSAVGAAGILFFDPATKCRLSTSAGAGIKDLTAFIRRSPPFLPPSPCAGSDHAVPAECFPRSLEEGEAEKENACATVSWQTTA
ncbi:MAG: hypothetical protein ABIL58_04890 [Pseudomonadota bacterium]